MKRISWTLIAEFAVYLSVAACVLGAAMYFDFAWGPRGDAEVSCKVEMCFYRKSGSAVFIPLSKGRVWSLSLGDQVATLGQSAKMEILFSDGAKADLKRYSLWVLSQGSHTATLADQGESEGPTGVGSTSAPAQSLIYFSRFALRPLYPEPRSRIAVTSFPHKMRLSMKLIEGGAAVGDEDRKGWRLYAKAQAGVSPVPFELALSAADTLEAELAVTRAGTYVVLPPGVDASTPGEHYEFEVIPSQNIDTAVQDLIKNYDSGQGSLEIRN